MWVRAMADRCIGCGLKMANIVRAFIEARIYGISCVAESSEFHC
jgi:hypothetical protein